MILEKILVEKICNLVYQGKTRKTYRSVLMSMAGVEIAFDPIQEMVAGWEDQPSSTIGVKRAALKGALEFLGESEGIDVSFMDTVKFPKGKPPSRRRPIKRDDKEKVMSYIENDLEAKLLFTILDDLGLRLGTVAGLNAGDVLAEVADIVSKGGGTVRIYPSKKVRDLAMEWCLSEEKGLSEPLFTKSNGDRATYKYLWQIVDYVRSECGVEFIPHEWRHAFATEMDDMGVSFPAIQRLMGHKDPATTSLYITPDEEKLRNAVQRRSER